MYILLHDTINEFYSVINCEEITIEQMQELSAQSCVIIDFIHE